MYVCICQGITDTQIRSAVEGGANNLREVRSELGLADQCGKCARLAKQVIRETLSDIHAVDGLFYAAT